MKKYSDIIFDLLIDFGYNLINKIKMCKRSNNIGYKQEDDCVF
jgi:hypothetical protein